VAILIVAFTVTCSAEVKQQIAIPVLRIRVSALPQFVGISMIECGIIGIPVF